MSKSLFCAALSALAVVAAARPAAAGAYGAIATNSAADVGYSYNYDTEQQARDRALAECAKHSKPCEVKNVIEDICVSVAWAKSGHAGWAGGRGQAKNDQGALDGCRKSGATDCEIAVRFCTGNP